MHSPHPARSDAPCLACNAENPPGATVCGTCGAVLAGSPAAAFGTVLPTGTQLKGGRYSVGRLLGRGGFGITYLGGDLRAGRPVAIKEVFPAGSLRRGVEVRPGPGDAAEFATAREKFRGEAALLAQFRHPGIVGVFDCFEEHGTAYMVMEYVRGRSLGDLLEERGLLTEHEAVDHIRRAGEALGVVHQGGLLHRDVKPDNLMLKDGGRVVLIDFGTARAFAAGMASRMTTLATPGYAPLEQYAPEARFGPYSDVYGLAATLYHLLTGRMPPPALSRVGGAELQAPHRLNPELNRAVSEAVMWGLEMRIDRRPQTVRDFTQALRPANARPGPPARRPVPPPHLPAPQPPPTPQPPPRAPTPPPQPQVPSPPSPRASAPQWLWTAALVCCIALLSGALVAWLWLRAP